MTNEQLLAEWNYIKMKTSPPNQPFVTTIMPVIEELVMRACSNEEDTVIKQKMADMIKVVDKSAAYHHQVKLKEKITELEKEKEQLINEKRAFLRGAAEIIGTTEYISKPEIVDHEIILFWLKRFVKMSDALQKVHDAYHDALDD
jgi:hypothetical protein